MRPEQKLKSKYMLCNVNVHIFQLEKRNIHIFRKYIHPSFYFVSFYAVKINIGRNEDRLFHFLEKKVHSLIVRRKIHRLIGTKGNRFSR